MTSVSPRRAHRRRYRRAATLLDALLALPPHAHAISRQDLIASAERIYYRYLSPAGTAPGATENHEIYLPPALRIHTFPLSSSHEPKSQSEMALMAQIPDIEVPNVTSPPLQHQSQPPAFGAPPTFAPQPAYSSTPILNQQIEEDEPEVIKQWREKQAAEIKARDEASKAKRQETIAKAERAIDSFYEEYAAKKERNIRENKEHEEEFLANLNASLTQGTTWQRICDIIDLQNSQSKTLARTGDIPGRHGGTRL
ncbi:hypothetical protein NUW54_g13761 [Trametes sanguinea]|uniref:Uncharacterized protein n=1 Tax=Trametes sanguinea TaxID=158606 RepID=A0ACC1MIY3_9APHY|nr:hypothetical protein NUW54_g13761 [Trametes sanguinea]